MGAIVDTSVALRDGTRIVIRSAIDQDARGLAEMESEPPEGNGQYFRYWFPMPFEQRLGQKEHWIRMHEGQPGFLCLVALAGDSVVGCLSFDHGQDEFHQHNGNFDIYVRPEWRSRGVGSAMVASLLDWAKNATRLEFMWLSVVSTNTPACRVYAKAGFQEEGRLRRMVKLRDGTYADSVFMSRWLRPPK